MLQLSKGAEFTFCLAFEFVAGNFLPAFFQLEVKRDGNHAVCPVIIPHTKHASSLAMATFAIQAFDLSWIRTYFLRRRSAALSAYAIISFGHPSCFAFIAFVFKPFPLL